EKYSITSPVLHPIDPNSFKINFVQNILQSSFNFALDYETSTLCHDCNSKYFKAYALHGSVMAISSSIFQQKFDPILEDDFKDTFNTLLTLLMHSCFKKPNIYISTCSHVAFVDRGQ